jgi:phospholipid transport system substrate-binding protein
MTRWVGKVLSRRAPEWSVAVALVIAIALSGMGLSAPALAAKAKAASALTASQTINAFHKDLISALRATDGKGFEARRKAFAPPVAKIFDANFMAKYAVGDTLAKFTPEQQKELVSSFSDMMVASYASRFKSYNGQRFEILSEGPVADQCDRLRARFEQVGTKQLPKECVLVKSQIIKANGETRNINYFVYRASASAPWKVVDVMSGSASELATRRSEFSSVARNQGPAALIDTVKDKVVTLAEGSGTEPASAIP